MSGRKPKRRKGAKTQSWYQAGWLSGLLLTAIAVYLGLSLFGGVGPWWKMVTSGERVDLVVQNNPGGPVGSYLSALLHWVFGAIWCWTFPAFLLILGLSFLFNRSLGLKSWLLRALPLWVVTASWIAQPGFILSPDNGARYGGAVGFYLARGFESLFGTWGSPIFLTLFLVVTLILVFKPWLGWLRPVLESVGRGFVALLGFLGSMILWPIHALRDGAEDLSHWLGDKKEARALERQQRLLEKEKRQAEKEVAAERVEPQNEDEAAEPAEPKTREPRRVHVAPANDEIEPPTFDDLDDVQAEDNRETDELALPGAAGEYMGEGEAPLAQWRN